MQPGKSDEDIRPELLKLGKEVMAQLDEKNRGQQTITSDEWLTIKTSTLSPFLDLDVNPEFNDDALSFGEHELYEALDRSAEAAVSGNLPNFLKYASTAKRYLGEGLIFKHDRDKLVQAIVFDLDDDAESGIYRDRDVYDKFGQYLDQGDDAAAVDLFVQATSFELTDAKVSLEDPTRVEVHFTYLSDRKRGDYQLNDYTDVIEMQSTDVPWELHYASNN
ncbi:hypothetical protein GXP70_02545 [Paenibacillus lycopersici]|uniref:Uncharacterized protein n=1 Tax=Paenibacillus lycopersici TaxID=2704462 RepID=A0A6C0FPA4_9BACL|nr:hypothetical protein [Paenibacillus lycopersici]QHT58948.1 hypothetical protein GXP70_02545 [Paenibacillus lycopersici]